MMKLTEISVKLKLSMVELKINVIDILKLLKRAINDP